VEATSKSYARRKVFDTIIQALEKRLGPNAPPRFELTDRGARDAELRAAMDSLTGGGL
jgi:hypothetical protein